MNREQLENYLNEGKSTNEIATLMGFASGSTVRFWMKKYGLVSTATGGKKIKSIELDDGTKLCTKCNQYKSINSFYKRTDRPRKLAPPL